MAIKSSVRELEALLRQMILNASTAAALCHGYRDDKVASLCKDFEYIVRDASKALLLVCD